MNKVNIPVGVSDFVKLRQNNYYYIDKSALIQELVTCSHHLNLTILKWGLPARLPFKAKLKQAIPACPAVCFLCLSGYGFFSCAVRHILYRSFFLLLGC